MPAKTAEPMPRCPTILSWSKNTYGIRWGQGAILREGNVICTANGWLKEQYKQFFCNGIRPSLEKKRQTKCISVAGIYAEK